MGMGRKQVSLQKTSLMARSSLHHCTCSTAECIIKADASVFFSMILMDDLDTTTSSTLLDFTPLHTNQQQRFTPEAVQHVMSTTFPKMCAKIDAAIKETKKKKKTSDQVVCTHARAYRMRQNYHWSLLLQTMHHLHEENLFLRRKLA